MKTVLIAPDSITPIKPKLELNFHKHKIFGTNVRNVNVDSFHKISDLMGNKKFRQSSNIFYIKINDKQRNSSKNNQKQPFDETYNIDFQKRQTKMTGFLPQIVNADFRKNIQCQLKPKVQSQVIQFDPIYQQTQLCIDGGNIDFNNKYHNNRKQNFGMSKKTQYILKKGPLNTELEFFRAYNRFQKSKTFQTPSNFNTQLNGIQKTFYHRKKPASIQRRSMSVRQNDKIHLDGNTTKSTNFKILQQLGIQSKKQSNIDKHRYFHKKSEIKNKNKEEIFSPWGVNSDQHQHDQCFKKQF